MTRIDVALKQIKQTRRYTLRLLENTDESEWFRQPAEGVTHIAWQVGHLAMAEYRLALERIRGRNPEDASLISDEFQAHFRRDSVPNPDASCYPALTEICAVLDRVHQQALRELPALTEQDLDSQPTAPHPLFDTKLGALLWCAQHEMLHAGQIGLLRRLLGRPPVW